jgi:hypothetical protein
MKFTEDSIGQEFDIGRFLTLQKEVRAALEVLFTPSERAVLRHNYRFVVDSSSGSSAESNEDNHLRQLIKI